MEYSATISVEAEEDSSMGFTENEEQRTVKIQIEIDDCTVTVKKENQDPDDVDAALGVLFDALDFDKSPLKE